MTIRLPLDEATDKVVTKVCSLLNDETISGERPADGGAGTCPLPRVRLGYAARRKRLTHEPGRAD